jgi:hypothetical protein
MANYTPNYNLYKPNINDSDVDVAPPLETNFETIDIEIKNRADEIETHIASPAAHTSDNISHGDGSIKTALEEVSAQSQDTVDKMNQFIVESSDNIPEMISSRGIYPSLPDRLNGVDSLLTDIAANIKSYGANADGSDSTQAFINASVLFKHIFVPEGTFVIDNLSLQDVVLFGNGTLKWKSGSTTQMLELKGRSTLQGLTLDGNASGQGSSTITAINLTSASKTIICNNLFTNFHYKVIVSDLALSPSVQVLNNRFESCGTVTSCDVVTVRSSDWLINGNYFDTIGNGHCVRLGLYDADSTVNSVVRTVISDNHFSNTQHVGVTNEIYSRNTLIANNVFDNLEQAIKCESTGNTVFEITIANNIIRNITLSTPLNLSATKVKFINNRCYNLVGGPYFGEYFDCSNNEFL